MKYMNVVGYWSILVFVVLIGALILVILYCAFFNRSFLQRMISSFQYQKHKTWDEETKQRVMEIQGPYAEHAKQIKQKMKMKNNA